MKYSTGKTINKKSKISKKSGKKYFSIGKRLASEISDSIKKMKKYQKQKLNE